MNTGKYGSISLLMNNYLLEYYEEIDPSNFETEKYHHMGIDLTRIETKAEIMKERRINEF